MAAGPPRGPLRPRLVEDRKRFGDALAQARAVMLPAQVPVNTRVLARAPMLRAIGRIVGGPEQLDLEACARAGVEVLRSPEAVAPAEAEFMLGALLTLLRPNPLAPHRIVGRELAHCTVGLVGMGPGARRLATLLQSLGTQVRGYDPALHASGAQWPRWGCSRSGCASCSSSRMPSACTCRSTAATSACWATASCHGANRGRCW